MHNLILINQKPLQIREFDSQRVVTFKDIDELHERVEGTAGRNFRENKHRFILKVDYFELTPDNFQLDEIRRFGIDSPRGGIIITESGYLMLVKSLTDDLAWRVQRELVNNYFRSKGAEKPESIQKAELLMSLADKSEIRGYREYLYKQAAETLTGEPLPLPQYHRKRQRPRSLKRNKKREWLVELRKDQDLFQEDVDDMCGMCHGWYGNFERGYRNPNKDQAQMIAGVLGFDWRWFFED